MNRRSALMALAGIVGAALLRCRTTRLLCIRSGPVESLSEDHIKTLGAAAECIYPEHPASSGALSLGVQNYLIKQLNTEHYRQALPALQHVVAVLDHTAKSRHGKIFVECVKAERNRIFDALVQGNVPADSTETMDAFNQLVDITLEGCFAHPRHGGNKGMKAWHIMKDALQEEWYVECSCTGYAG